MTIGAFKIAEDKRVLLPVAVNMDGFILTHMIEPIEFPDQKAVDKFLPAYKPQLKLDPKKPVTFGPVGVPEVYIEAKKQCEQALLDSQAVVEEVFGQLKALTGRSYKPIETNGKKKAKTLFVTMGSLGESTWTAVEGLNKAGEDVGQVRIRLWRPFPAKEFRAACKGAKKLIVIDRAVSPGSVCGPVAQEIKSVFYGHKDAPEIVNVIAGLGGRDVPIDEFQEMYRLAKQGKLAKTYTLWGLDSNA